MRRIISLAGICVFVISMMIGVSSALAGHGALAVGVDETTLKYGLSSNEESQKKAEEAALKECGSDKCKIVFKTVGKKCGAIATPEDSEKSENSEKTKSPVWGAADRPQRAAAELAAINNCQKRTKRQCKVRSVECNNK